MAQVAVATQNVPLAAAVLSLLDRMPSKDRPVGPVELASAMKQDDFLKVHESGTITKAYENDDVNFPSDRLGSIEVGKAADFLLLAIDRLHAVPLFDPITHIVYSSNRSDVTDVFVAGRQLVTDGRLVTADVAALVAAVRGLGPRIRASIA